MGYVKSQPRALDQSVPAVRESRVATLLVVDDCAEVRQQLRLMLEDMGHAVIVAPSVQQALALIRQAIPDTILSATQIPGVDGFELCRQLQQDPTLRHVPLVLIAEESGGPYTQRFAQDVGAAAVLMKPVTPQDLRAAVDMCLSLGCVPDATQKLRRLDNEGFHKRHSEELIAQLQTKAADLEQLSRRYRLLSETNQAIARIRNREELLHAICRIAAAHEGLRLAAIVLADQSDRRPLLVDVYRAAAGSPAGIDAALDEFSNAGRGLSAKTLQSGKLLVVNDIVNDPKTVSLHESARRAGIGAMAVCPVRYGGVSIGALEVYACTAGFFRPEILRTFEEMAEDIGFGLYNHAREVEHAAALQRAADALEYNRVLIESSPIGIVTYNATGGVVSINTAAANLTGGTVKQLASQNLREIESWKTSGLLSLAEQALATNRVADEEFHVASTADGTEAWIRANGTYLSPRSIDARGLGD